jgi:hypothetical protein
MAKIFSTKKWQKYWRCYFKILLIFEKFVKNINFSEKRQFYRPKRRKSTNFVILTLTPSQGDQIGRIFFRLRGCLLTAVFFQYRSGAYLGGTFSTNFRVDYKWVGVGLCFLAIFS